MKRPVRTYLSPKNLTIMGVPKKFHDMCIEDFLTYKQKDLVKVRDYIQDYLNRLPEVFDNNEGLFLYGSNGVGKAQPLYSKVLTESGWKTMGDIRVGDKVYNRRGNLCKVTGVFPQGVKPCFRVTFLDGRTVDCCDEHLWSYYTSRGNLNTSTLRDMITKGLKFSSSNQYRYKVPVNESIPFEHKDLPIDPYVLGVLIGDGCMTQINLSFSSVEEDIVDRVRAKLGDSYSVKKYNTCNHNYGVSYLPEYHSNPLHSDLIEMGLDCKSVDKFIPPLYLFSSEEQRLELLKGLFDTDGSIAKNGSFSYSTCSKKLFEDIMHLCRSLGIQCSGHSYDRGDKGIEYDVQIMTDKVIFSSVKHTTRWNQFCSKKRAKNTTSYSKVPISNVEYVGECPMQCIMVNDSEHLYLTDNFVVTHNTFIACMIVKEAYRRRYTSRRVTFVEYISAYTRMWGARTPDEKELLEQEFYNNYKAVEFLVIEEIGKEIDSKVAAPILEDCLRYREDHGLVTIICTNLDIQEMKERYGASSYSLMQGNMTPVLIEGKDKRREFYSDRLED